MKYLKIIIIAIIVYSSFIYANNEIVEKDGNTTKIKLLDDENDNKINKSKLFGSSDKEDDIKISIKQTPKIDFIINNADKTLGSKNFENDINIKLNELGIDTSEILYYKTNIERMSNFIEKTDSDVELLNFGVSTPSSIATFSNIKYKEEELTYLSLEDFEPDNIEHACSFVSASNDKFHWEFCSLCGESAELLETINNNTISKPTDNDDETKGNRNIEEHKYDNNRIVLHTVYNYCNNCIIYGYCSCGKYGVYGTTYNTGYGKLSSCRGCNYEHTMGTSLTTITYHGSTARYYRCTRCGCPGEAINPSCESSKRHNMYIPTEVNQTSVCLCKQCSFKCLKYEYTIDKINKKIIVNTQYQTNRNDATFNNSTPYNEEDDEPEKNSYPTNVNVSNSLVSSSGGKYIYNYTFNISFNESTPLNSSMIFLRELNTSNGFMISISTTFNITEFTSPTIISVASTSMAAHIDENGKSWITQKQYIFTGTENSHFVALKIVDLFGNIYFNNSCVKEGNNWSINFTPNIEANVKKTLKATAYDRSGNESEPYYFDIDTTDCKSPVIISNLDYRDNWKNKIIYKAEAYEGGIGLTQIALNKNSDFKFVDKIENPDKSGNDIYYRYYVFQGDVYGDDIITPTLFARDGLNHLDSKKILIGKLDSTKPTIENINISNNQIEIIANDKHMTKGEGSGIKAFSVVPIGKNPTLSSFKFTENIIQIDYNGEYDVYAIDNAGNISNNYEIKINIKNEAINKYREDAIKVFNYIDNDINYIFKDENYIANNICLYDGNFIWLTDKNKEFYKNYINYIDGNSSEDYTHYIDNSMEYDDAIKNTAQYIKKLIDNEYNSNYYLLENKINIDIEPNDKKYNQISTEYPNGMYYINHNSVFFDNTMGECDNTNKNIENLECNFDKVGEFNIKYCDEIISNLYIHRKPNISFDINKNNNNLSLNSNSFDYDTNKNIGYGKGIKEENWYWKHPTDTNWHLISERLNGEVGKTILIKLEIKDNQNYKTKLIKSFISDNEGNIYFNIINDNINTNNIEKVSKHSNGGSPLFSQKYLDELNNKKELKEEETEPKTKYKNNKKKKDIVDMLNEIYTDWEEQNNITKKKKFDIVDFIKAVYEDFNKNHK